MYFEYRADHLNRSTPINMACESSLNYTTLNISLMLGMFIVIVNTSIGIGMGRIGPKVLQGNFKQ